MSGAEKENKKMRISPSVAAKNNLVIGYLNSVPDVKAVKTGDLSGEIIINGHEPLEKIKYEYICKARLWTKDYDLEYEASVDTSLKNGIIEYRNNSFNTKSVNEDIRNLTGRFNDNTRLGSIISRLDILKLKIIISDGRAAIKLRTMTFGITKMIIPPVTHMIKPSGRECIDCFQLIQILYFLIKA